MSERESAQFSDSTNQILRALDGETVTRNPAFSATTNAILDAIEDGGGGLPEVTSADNGKVLGVVNGAWDKTESKGLVVATITYNVGLSGYICDKTNEEILAAIAAGNTVVAKYGDNLYRLAKYLTTGDKTIYFEWSNPSSNYQVKKEFRVGALGVTTYFEHTVLPTVTASNAGTGLIVSDGGNWVDERLTYDVEFQMAGAPSGNDYPLYTATPLTDILKKIQQGRPVVAALDVSALGVQGQVIHLPLSGFDYNSEYERVLFGTITYDAGRGWMLMQIYYDDNTTVGMIVPVSIAS